MYVCIYIYIYILGTSWGMGHLRRLANPLRETTTLKNDNTHGSTNHDSNNIETRKPPTAVWTVLVRGVLRLLAHVPLEEGLVHRDRHHEGLPNATSQSSLRYEMCTLCVHTYPVWSPAETLRRALRGKGLGVRTESPGSGDWAARAHRNAAGASAAARCSAPQRRLPSRQCQRPFLNIIITTSIYYHYYSLHYYY